MFAMSRSQWLMFKRVGDRYVFRAPDLWPFVRGRYYWVDEKQRAQIGSTADSAQRSSMRWGSGILAAVILTGTWLEAMDSPWFWVAFILLAALGFAGLQAHMIQALRPLVADLPHTDQRFTWHDHLQTCFDTSSPLRTLFFDLALVELLLVCGVFTFALRTTSAFGVALLACFIITMSVILLCLVFRVAVRLRQPRSSRNAD
jgi:4-amino-4-deoxy-L-arabinose transferase-like glycosyltransferase